MQNSTKKYISSILKKMNLAEFIEREAKVSFNKIGDRYVCICPMPFHKDSKPSFGVGENSDGIWLYNCFGCGTGGSIIDFTMDYFGIETFEEAVTFLMEHFEIKSDVELVSKAIKEAKVTVDAKKRLECEHIQAASACRTLLKNNPRNKEVQDWVGKSYREMNSLLKAMDVKGITKIKNEVVRRLV